MADPKAAMANLMAKYPEVAGGGSTKNMTAEASKTNAESAMQALVQKYGDGTKGPNGFSDNTRKDPVLDAIVTGPKPENKPIANIKAFGADSTGAEKAGLAVGAGIKQAAASAVNLLGAFTPGNLTIGEQMRAGNTEAEQQAAANEKRRRQQNDMYRAADRLADSAQADIAEAKEGAGKLGSFLVDLGVSGTQLVGDVLMNTVAPGTGLWNMGLRVFGNSAQEARRNGATENQQFAYAAANTAVEVLTEKLFGGLISGEKGLIAQGLERTAGGRALLNVLRNGAGKLVNDTVGEVAQRAGGQIAGKALRDFGGEAFEEIVAGVVEPLLNGIYNSKGIRENWNEIQWQQVLKEGLAGGILGVIGGGFGNVMNGQQTEDWRNLQFHTGDTLAERNAQGKGNLTPAQENAPTGQETGNTGIANLSENPTRSTGDNAGTVEANRDNSERVEETAKNDSLGSAMAGFTTPNSQGEMRTSNLESGALKYDPQRGEASSLSREDYSKLFQYKSVTEEQSMALADDMLYVGMPSEVEGQPPVRTFLMDADREAYDGITDYLRNAPAWNGVMTDAANVIEHELMVRSQNLDISEDEYTEWLNVMREHASETGRGIQAWNKWTTGENRNGTKSRMEAMETLEKSNLSDEEKSERFARIVKFDMRIEQAQTDDELRDIIIDIAKDRGTLSGLSGNQSNRLTNTARRTLSAMSTSDLKQFAYASSSAIAADAIPSNAGQKLKTVQVLNMLSNPKTAATNLLGNTAFYGLDALAMRGAAILDMAVSGITGTRSIAMERFALDKSGRQAINEAIKRSAAEVLMDVDMGAENRYMEDMGRTFKANGQGVFNKGTGAGKFTERILSVLERNMGFALTTSDEAYKGAARRTAEATRDLILKGKIKTKSAEQSKSYATDQAEKLALYRTFQNNSKISAAVQTIHDVLNLIGVGDSGKTIKGISVKSVGAGDIVAPFARVAANLVQAGIDYSPYNLVRGGIEIVKPIADAARGITVDPEQQAKALSDAARGLTGTGVAALAMILAKMGLLRRADDEEDEDVAKLNKSEGMTGTQVNFDAWRRFIETGDASWQYGDTLVDLSRIQPLNYLMTFGFNLAEEDEDNGVVSAFKDSASSIVQSAGDLPVVQSVADFAKEVFVYKKDPIPTAAEEAGKTVISSLTPNVLAAAAKGADENYRNVYSGDGVTDVLRDTLISRIPGARKNLPTSQNSLGETTTYQGGAAKRILDAMLNPVGVNTYLQSEVSQELQRVRAATGDASFYPTTRKPESVSYTDKDGEKHEVALDYDQRQKYQETAGKTQSQVTKALIDTDYYRTLDDIGKAEVLTKAYQYANELAKADVIGEKNISTWARNAKNAKRDFGLSTAEFIADYLKYGSNIMSENGYAKVKKAQSAGMSIDDYVKMKDKMDADGNDSITQAEAQAYLDSTSYTNSQKAALWNVINKSWKKNPYK